MARKHRIARQGRIRRPAQHHGQNQRGLDNGDRACEDQRAERFSYPVGDDLAMMDRREDAADKDRAGSGKSDTVRLCRMQQKC